MKEFNLKGGIVMVKDGMKETAFTIEMHEADMPTFDVADVFRSKYNDLIRLMSKQNTMTQEEAVKAQAENEDKETTGEEFIAMMNIMGSDFDRKEFFKAFNKLCDSGLVKVEGQNLNANLRSKMAVTDYYNLIGEYVVSFLM